MALKYTPSPEIGMPCPEFSLSGVDNKRYSLDDFKNKEVLVVMFICNHCPYVNAIEDRFVALAHEMQPQGVQFIGICSNDAAEYPEDSVPELKKRWQQKKYNFPYLHDANQNVAKSFNAVCTPDIFVYDKSRTLVYRGRFDDSWKDPRKVTREELKLAILNTLEKKYPFSEQNPSMGCSIKWIE